MSRSIARNACAGTNDASSMIKRFTPLKNVEDDDTLHVLCSRTGTGSLNQLWSVLFINTFAAIPVQAVASTWNGQGEALFYYCAIIWFDSKFQFDLVLLIIHIWRYFLVDCSHGSNERNVYSRSAAFSWSVHEVGVCNLRWRVVAVPYFRGDLLYYVLLVIVKDRQLEWCSYAVSAWNFGVLQEAFCYSGKA